MAFASQEQPSSLPAQAFLQPRCCVAGSGIADLVAQGQRLFEDVPGLWHALLSAENLTQEMAGFRRSPQKPAFRSHRPLPGFTSRFLGSRMLAGRQKRFRLRAEELDMVQPQTTLFCEVQPLGQGAMGTEKFRANKGGVGTDQVEETQMLRRAGVQDPTGDRFQVLAT